MEHTNTPFLCGGVVVSLIVLAKSTGIPRKRVQGDSDDNSNPNILHALEKAIDPSGPYMLNSTHKKETSYYLNCNKLADTSKALALSSAVVAEQYDDEVKKRNPAAVERMAEFIDAYLPENRRMWLLKAILEILEFDQSIDDNEEFYISGDGSSTAKAKIRAMTRFSLEAFITGIIHYIMVKRTGENYMGADTIAAYSLKKKSGCHLGQLIAREIVLDQWIAPQTIESDNENPEPEKVTEAPPRSYDEMSDIDVLATDAVLALLRAAKAFPHMIKDKADAIRRQQDHNDDPADETVPAPDKDNADSETEIHEQTTNQVAYINHQTNVYQNAGPGGKNIHIEHVDKIEL